MSGHAAMSGFNFQNAHAVLDLLQMTQDPHASYARVEGVGDELDFELYGFDDALLVGKQLKTRGRERAWSAADILKEANRWQQLPLVRDNTRFEFVTNGRLGPTAIDLLQSIGRGDHDTESLSDVLDVDDFASSDILRRVSILADVDNAEVLLERCIDAATTLLTDSSSAEHAISRAKYAVGQLFRIVALKSGRSNPMERIISVSEVKSILGHSVAVDLEETWNDEVFERAIFAVKDARVNTPRLDIEMEPTERKSADTGGPAEAVFLQRLMSTKVGFLYGASGSGKTTLLEGLSMESADQQRLLLKVDAYEYSKGRLRQLVANALNALYPCGAFNATGDAVLKDPRVIVAIDNSSEISRALQRTLGEEIREILAMELHCGLLLTGRRLVAMKGLVPPTRETTSITVRSLSVAKQVELLDFWGYTIKDFNRQKLVTQGGPGTSTPLFLKIAATAAQRGALLRTPAQNYENFIVDRSEAVGVEEGSTYLAVASEVVGSLSPEHRSLCPSYDFRQASLQCCLRTGVEVSEFERFCFKSGLFVRQAGDKVAPFHDSLADYLLARAVSFGLVQAENVEKEQYSVQEFMVQLGVSSMVLADSLARTVPYVLPRLARWEKITNGPLDWEFVSRTLGFLLPKSIEITAQDVKGANGYVQVEFRQTEARAYTNAPSFELPASPMTIAVNGRETWLVCEIWRQYLKANLRNQSRGYIRRPRTVGEYKELLSSYAEGLDKSVAFLVQSIIPESMSTDLVREVGFYSYQFMDPNEQDGGNSRRDTIYVLRDEPASPRFLTRDDILKRRRDGNAWGRATEDAFTSRNPHVDGARLVAKALDRLVGFPWF